MRSATLVFLVAVAARSGDAAASAPRDGHPEPRVIVDVLRVTGPHDASAIEHEARRLLWGKIVGCYRPAAQRRPKLRGDAVFKFRAGAGGDVSAVHKVKTTLDDGDVVACWAKHVRNLPLPRATRASDVVMQIHVAPGDAPPVDERSVHVRP